MWPFATPGAEAGAGPSPSARSTSFSTTTNRGPEPGEDIQDWVIGLMDALSEKFEAAVMKLEKQMQEEKADAREELRESIAQVQKNAHSEALAILKQTHEGSKKHLEEMELSTAKYRKRMEDMVTAMREKEAFISNSVDVLNEEYREMQIKQKLREVSSGLFQLKALEMNDSQRQSCINSLSKQQRALKRDLATAQEQRKADWDSQTVMPVPGAEQAEQAKEQLPLQTEESRDGGGADIRPAGSVVIASV
eukprot:TRINITY_DN51180_c0_g1_i1.p1 TRINITY_DN51180_c0_g1~~TRINITY_DN51180_c0_g1_i1.p1  ORF type:complete len:262 (+),score=75.21 TRINITY_DN51180_c0_g1_i1:38-787(+)